MKHGMIGIAAALALGASLGAIWPTPDHAEAHKGHALDMSRSAAYDYDPPAPGSYRLARIRAAGDGQVLEEDGTARSLRNLLDGKVTVLSFIYTHCNDICPEATLLLHELYWATTGDSALGERLQLLSLSFDPENDTPEMMAMFGDALRDAGEAAADWRFLTTAGPHTLEPMLAAYDQPLAVVPEAEGPHGRIAHQLRVYLIDRQRQVRNIYSLDFLDPRLVITDVQTLLLEEQGVAAGS
jgi:cytochrome oxidase Cu insertion factor (SCO1/SenC/PrrC family)